MSERPEDLDVTALESALRELRPRSEQLDRAVVMYRAGQASARGWVWPVATLFSTAVAFLLSVALWIRLTPQVVYVAVPAVQKEVGSAALPAPSPANDRARGAWSRYVHLQEQVLLHGLDGLPSAPSETEDDPSSVEALFNSL